MKIPNDYYEAEVRDGFYVPSEMKRCWAATIGVLEKIDSICSRHGLKYFADFGTLLGAVRHGGFVPWDDDFDISMTRDDYMAFLDVAQEELPEGYVLLSVYNNREYDNHFISRVVNSGFMSFEQDFLEANHNFPFSVGIDIYVLDFYGDDPKKNDKIKDLILKAHSVLGLISPDATDVDLLDKSIRSRVRDLFDRCGTRLEKGKYIRQQLFILVNELFATYDSTAPYLAHMYFVAEHGNHIYRKEIFENTVMLPFEYMYIPAPIGYSEKLEKNYGPNYIKPYKGGGIHDYPLYGKQRDLMQKATGKEYYKRYVFKPSDLERPVTEPPKRERREIVFLPARAKNWPYMEKEWERAVLEEDTDVYVIPVPFYEKSVYDTCGDIRYEADMFPDYVPVIPFDRYDFDNRIPDRIVIQDPFDDYDNAYTVHPRFYTDKLLAATKELVYIPCFEIDDADLNEEKTSYTADFFVKTPGVVRSDKVYLQSESVKEMYISKLCEMAGKNTRSVWENKLEVREYILPEKNTGICEEDIPDGWWQYLLDENNEGKKVILFHTSISNIVMTGEKYTDKLKKVLDTFADNKDKLTPIWHTSYGTKKILEGHYPDLWNSWKALLDRYMADGYGIYEDNEDYSRLVEIADAYYGDRDRIMHDFVKTGRPVMILNVDI